MSRRASSRLSAVALAVAFACMSASPAGSTVQTVTGQARAVQATTLTTIILADTGTLGSTSDARDATLTTGNVPSLLSAEVLRRSRSDGRIRSSRRPRLRT